jgi:sec-independent protein translocase protein TatA
MSLGVPELLIVLLVVLVIFGGSQLPKLARGLGSAQHEFKKGLEEGHTEDDKPAKSDKSDKTD